MSDVINRLFKQLRQMEKKYDLIIVDTGAGANKAVIDILLNADANVVVTSPEPTAVMDAYVIIKLLNHNRYEGKKFVIVNKCGGREKGEETFDNLNTAVLHFLKEKLELIGTVDYDPSVNKSIINQQLFVKSHPVHPVSGSLARVSKALHEYVHLANIHHSRRS